MELKFANSVASVRIKITLISVALVIAVGTLYYTQQLVQQLQNRERQIVELYANSLEYISNSSVMDSDFTFVFENIIKRIDFPLILTDANDKVNYHGTGEGLKNLDIDSTMTNEDLEAYLQDKLEQLANEYTPIIVTHEDPQLGKIILGKIYYGDSDLVRMLQYYPYLQIFFAIIFLLISYISFSYLKKNEQSNIWVGMAKETAHQLGTPISSLMGWSELLKINYQQPDKVIDVADEIDSDLTRLNKIANRFSKIGSQPELKIANVYSSIEKVISYFSRRLPHQGRNVNLTIEGDSFAESKLNVELFEWVIENLIKNALDAIGKEDGNILFELRYENNQNIIDVTDTGKGFDMKIRKDIFRPGYSTKKRGWGLGLSLSKRIVEDYHSGKIFVKESVLGEGTTFRIVLKSVN